MDGNDRIDLGPLDPKRDAERFEAMVQAVARRALERRGAAPIARQLVGWSRPTIAAAALLAMIVWLGAILRPASTGAATTMATPHGELTTWAWNDEVPATATVLEVLGGDDGAR